MENTKTFALIATNLETKKTLSFRFDKVAKICKNSQFGFIGKTKDSEPYRINRKYGKCEVKTILPEKIEVIWEKE